jgi:hypothetical protein
MLMVSLTVLSSEHAQTLARSTVLSGNRQCQTAPLSRSLALSYLVMSIDGIVMRGNRAHHVVTGYVSDEAGYRGLMFSR